MSSPHNKTRTLPKFTPLRGLRFEVIAVSSALNLLSLALPIVMLQTYDRVIPNTAGQTLAVLIFGMGLVLILDAVLSFGRSYVTGWVGARTQHFLSSLAMERLFHADLRSFEAVAPGVHMQRFRAVDAIKNYYAGQALLSLVDLPFAVLFLVLIGLIAGKLALVPAGILTILAIFAVVSGRALSRALSYRAVGDERRHNFMIEILSNIHTVKALAMETLIVRRYERLQASSSQASYLVNLAEATARNMGLTLSQVTAVAVGAYGSTMVMSGQLTIGGLAASTLLASRAAQPLLRSLGIWTQFQNAQVARGQVGELFNLPQEAKPDAPSQTVIKGQVTLADLNFGYSENSEQLLRKVNLQIEIGDVVGISGANGSGKSTILGLIMGALAPSSGRIQIDNNDVWEIDPAALHRQVVYLPQNGVMFQGTIMDNLTMFNGQRYVDRAMYFADRLGLHEAVGKMPRGYETLVEYRTTTHLPGGIRQRIALVRALTMADDPRLILCDEAYTQLDRASDDKLRAVLQEFVGKCTILIASHRPSYLSLANRVFVIRNGELVLASAGARDSIEALQKEFA